MCIISRQVPWCARVTESAQMQDRTSGAPPSVLQAVHGDLQTAGIASNLNETTGALLRTLAVSQPGGVFLQLGRGCCELTAWIVDGMDITSRLVAVVIDPSLREISERHLGDDIRIAFHNQDALAFLTDIRKHRFHLIVFDEVPCNGDMVSAAAELVASGGFLIVTGLDSPQAEMVPEIMEIVANLEGFHAVRLSGSADAAIATRCGVTHKPIRRGGRKVRMSSRV